MTEQRPSKERVIKLLRQVVRPYLYDDGNEPLRKLQHEGIEGAIALLEESAQSAEKADRLNSDLAWIRRRTGFWGEVPPAVEPPDAPKEQFQSVPQVCQHDLLAPNPTVTVDPTDPFAAHCDACGYKWRTRAAQPPGDGQ